MCLGASLKGFGFSIIHKLLFSLVGFFLVLVLKMGFLGFRARELFYYLKGGQVDYGEEHSKACGHSQFGRVYEQGNRSPALQLALSVRVFLF